MSRIDLRQGDCLELMKDIPDGSVDTIITDPPYLYLKHKLDRPFDEKKVFSEWDRIVKDDGFLVFFGRGGSFHRWNYLLNEMGWEFKEEIVWDKRYSTSPVLPIQRMHETISLLSKNGKVRRHKIPYIEVKQFEPDRMQDDLKKIMTGMNEKSRSFEPMKKYFENGTIEWESQPSKTKSGTTVSSKKGLDRTVIAARSIVEGHLERSIIQVKRESRSEIKHPTQKPVRLMERLIFCVTDESQTVLDPFMGSGSTGVACVNTNRNFIGFEIDDEYFDIAKERIENQEVADNE